MHKEMSVTTLRCFKGMILAVPMMVIIKIVCENFSLLHPVSIILGSWPLNAPDRKQKRKLRKEAREAKKEAKEKAELKKEENQE